MILTAIGGRHALDLHHELDILARGQDRNQVERLEYEANLVQS